MAAQHRFRAAGEAIMAPRPSLGRVAYWLAWPGVWMYLRYGARTRVLVLAEDHVLLVQGWFSDDKWGLPGGGLHRHELPADGAVRELAEETGVRVQPQQLRTLGSEQRGRNGLTFYCHFFAITLPARLAVTKQRGEIVAVEWVPLADIGSLLHKTEIDRALELLAQRH